MNGICTYMAINISSLKQIILTWMCNTSPNNSVYFVNDRYRADRALFWMELLKPEMQLAKCMYTLGKKGCYTPGWCVFFVIISISSVREV